MPLRSPPKKTKEFGIDAQEWNQTMLACDRGEAKKLFWTGSEEKKFDLGPLVLLSVHGLTTRAAVDSKRALHPERA
jgi:hypothetical protein